MQPFWKDLYNAGADVVLTGHNHDYERFAPQDADRRPRQRARHPPVRRRHRRRDSSLAFGVASPNSQVRNNDTFGVLKLTLHPTSYDWQFVPEAGKTFTDSGSTACH